MHRGKQEDSDHDRRDDQPSPSPGAEVYDPATSAFTASGAPLFNRVLHKATALVIRGRTQPQPGAGGRVVRLGPGERRGGVSGAAAVG